MILPSEELYHVHRGDCIRHMASLPGGCMDMAVYSPPFPSTYSYTSLPEDLGNCEDLDHEIKISFSFLFRQMARVMKPGRVMMVHCAQIQRMKRCGGTGAYDFRGLLIRLAQRSGFIYEYDWVIRKNPQAQAIRTRSRSLQFAGLEGDRAQSRGAMPDYLIKFVAPGDNDVPIDSPHQVSRNEWIAWAECCWDDIRETDTLNTKEAKSDTDVKHICALQLQLISRAIRLYSNPGEVVFSPFAGIGSEGHEAIRLNRRFYGCEIKPEYHRAALANLARAAEMSEASQQTLFDSLAETSA